MTLLHNLWRLVRRYLPGAAVLLGATLTLAATPPDTGHLVTGAYWLRLPAEDAEVSWLEARDPVIGVSSDSRNLFAVSAAWEFPSGWAPTFVLGRVEGADYGDEWKQRPPYRRVADLSVSGGGSRTVYGFGVTKRWP